MTARAEDLNLPVGFRFHPTEVELVSYYLQLKVQGHDYHANIIIADIKICNYEPWDLPAKSLLKSDNDEWFFFSRPEYIPNKNNQIKRITNEGYWKITGKERVIKARGNKVVGKKRTLTFYRGRNRNNQITNWVIHEYYIPQTNTANQRDVVLCRLKKKSDKKTEATTCDEGEPSNNASDVENELQSALHMDQMQYTWRLENDLPSGFGDNESVDIEEFLESALVDPGQELTHTAHFNDSTAPRVLSVVCADDGVYSDADKEALSAQTMMDVKLSSRAEKQGASSDNEATPTFQINCIDLAFDEYYTNERGRRTGYPQRFPRDAVKLREKPLPEKPKPKEPEKCRPAVNFHKEYITESERRTVVDLHQKDSITKSNKDKKVTQGKDSEKDMKQTHRATTASNWKGSSFISWETSPLTSPPSVYFFNAVLGAFLFVVFAREVVLYGNWC